MKIKVLNKEDNESRARNPTYTIEIPNEEIGQFIDRFGEKFGKAFGKAIVKGLETDTDTDTDNHRTIEEIYL